MVILDTDVLSWLLTEGSPIAVRIRERLRMSGESDAITMVTVQEQLRGRLAYCSGAKTVEQYVEGLRRLADTLEDYRERMILNFDDAAAAAFKMLKAAKIRVGTMDLRIASIALARDATVVTVNVSDFRRVPGLKVEDWTAA